MQLGFYFDQTRCTGCFTCVVACKDWHNIPAGPASWRRVLTIEKGQYPDVFVAFFSTTCFHCATPICVEVCPVKAITKRKVDGVVIVDSDLCLGKEECLKCLKACPYNAPQFGIEKNAKMQKCHFCLDRLGQGQKPACVEACPLRALDAGPIDDLKTRYGDSTEAEGFRYIKRVRPSLVLKPKKDTKNLLPVKTMSVPGQWL